MSIKFKVNGQWKKAKVYAIVDAIHTAFSSQKLSSTNVSDALDELADGKEQSMASKLARAEALGHHAENVPIVVLDDWARTLAFAFDNDYQQAHHDVLPNGSRLLKCVISDGTNSSELNEIPFCHGTNLLADSNFLKIVGFAVYDENGLFSNQTWLGQAYNMGLEEFTAEIWWEE